MNEHKTNERELDVFSDNEEEEEEKHERTSSETRKK